MNLTTLLALAQTPSSYNKYPMNKQEEQAFREIIDNARFTPNGHFLIFDFSPYQNREEINLVNVEIFVDLFILANDLRNSFTYASPIPKFFSVAGEDEFWSFFGVNKEDWHQAGDPKDERVLYFTPLLSWLRVKEKHGKCCFPSRADVFLRNLALEKLNRQHLHHLPQQLLDVLVVEELPSLKNMKKKVLAQIKNDDLRCDLATVEEKDNFVRMLLRHLDDTAFLYWFPSLEVEAEPHLKDISYLKPEKFETGDFVTLSGRIVKTAVNVTLYNYPLGGKCYEKITALAEVTENGKIGELIDGIMLDDSSYVEFVKVEEKNCLHYELNAPADWQEKIGFCEYLSHQQYEQLMRKKDKLNVILKKFNLPLLEGNIVYKMFFAAGEGLAVITPKNRLRRVLASQRDNLRLKIHSLTNGKFYQD